MKRRKARELAMIFLYQQEIKNELDRLSEESISSFLEEQEIKDEEIEGFTRLLIKGTIENLPLIDKRISDSSINWSLKRMPYIDRNVMRIAIYEMLFVDTVPEIVSINEAIELAKKYGSRESPKFVNGILHKIKEEYVKKSSVTLPEDEKK